VKARLVEHIDPGPFPKLEDLLLEWVWVNKHSAKEWEWNDCPWWYNERASLSTLAGAVWNVGGVVLEEYASKKRSREGKYSGRCDLYFQIGKTEFIAEAKQCWLSTEKNAGSTYQYVSESLNMACARARDNRAGTKKREKLIGIVFAVPHITPSGVETRGAKKIILEWQQEILKIKNCALAWVFPLKTWKLEAEDDGYVYPGIAMLIRNAIVHS